MIRIDWFSILDEVTSAKNTLGHPGIGGMTSASVQSSLIQSQAVVVRAKLTCTQLVRRTAPQTCDPNRSEY
jgi:hypothetical protein